MKKLWKYGEYFGRMGELEGVFVADEAEVQKAMGRTVYFGEVLGKHSDISTTLDGENVTLLTDDQEFIQKAKEYGLVPVGIDPIAYLRDQDEDEAELNDDD